MFGVDTPGNPRNIVLDGGLLPPTVRRSMWPLLITLASCSMMTSFRFFVN